MLNVILSMTLKAVMPTMFKRYRRKTGSRETETDSMWLCVCVGGSFGCPWTFPRRNYKQTSNDISISISLPVTWWLWLQAPNPSVERSSLTKVGWTNVLYDLHTGLNLSLSIWILPFLCWLYLDTINFEWPISPVSLLMWVFTFLDGSLR